MLFIYTLTFPLDNQIYIPQITATKIKQWKTTRILCIPSSGFALLSWNRKHTHHVRESDCIFFAHAMTLNGILISTFILIIHIKYKNRLVYSADAMPTSFHGHQWRMMSSVMKILNMQILNAFSFEYMLL